MIKRIILTLSAGVMLASTVSIICNDSAQAQGQTTRKVPYWASLEEGEARMRTGPSQEYPVKWVYKRKDLPVKVVGIYEIWRKVEDPDGDQGWMHVRLLSPNRTALVTGTGNAALRESPSATAPITWRVQPGVVGRLNECENSWCRLDIKGRTGYIEAERLWGDEAP